MKDIQTVFMAMVLFLGIMFTLQLCSDGAASRFTESIKKYQELNR